MSSPLPAVANVVRTVINGTNSINNWANVLHWIYTGGPLTIGAVTNIANALLNVAQTNLLPIMPTETMIVDVTATDLSSDTGAGYEALNPQPGSSTADKLPGGTCVLVDYPSSFRYRGGHPRTYLYVGADENMLNECTWNDAFVATVGDLWLGIQSTMTGIGGDGSAITGPCAVSYENRTANPVAPYRRTVPLVMPFGVGNFNVQPVMASQRRRVRRSR
jgi:hypothetical protein